MGADTERFGKRLVRAVKAGGWLVPFCFIGGNPEQFVPARAVRHGTAVYWQGPRNHPAPDEHISIVTDALLVDGRELTRYAAGSSRVAPSGVEIAPGGQSWRGPC